MKVHNALPHFLECLRRWETAPSAETFVREYFEPLRPLIGVVFDEDGEDFHSVISDLNWKVYRHEALKLDPEREETRLRRAIAQVEALFGIPLAGDAVLFSAFHCMDGYARFDEGTHRVFLGVDESHGRARYLDVLITHELTHVVRESRHAVWKGFGLDPMMTHDDFTETLPVIEHVFGEGFSCAVSEILVPGEDPWHYAYQSEDSLAQVLEHGPAVDAAIKKEILSDCKKPGSGDYGRLYNPRLYGRGMPGFTHYVWGWKWACAVIRDLGGGDPRKVVERPSSEFLEHALAFKLD
ncbi:MAG: hypothetical protein ACXWP5_09005 [Bdellovibrionota bacterium]